MNLPSPSRLTPRHVAATFVVAGLVWTAIAVLDPGRPNGRIWGVALAIVGLAASRWVETRQRWLTPAACLALLFSIAAFTQPEDLRADSASYYVYLRSAAFDRDLDFANEWRHWGYAEMPVTPTGRRFNQHTVGPALFWSPFFALSHVYVTIGRTLGITEHEADGYSAPYLRASALGTITAALVGAWLLGTMLTSRVSPRAAALSVVGAVLVSPIAFYLFVVPAMAHGLTFALAAALVWAVDRVLTKPTLRGWIVVGALTGALGLVRLQAGAVALLPLLVGVVQIVQRRVDLRAPAAGALAAVLVFSPQFVVWKILYGSFFKVPAGPGTRSWGPGLGFFDPRSPRALDVLISADHGLFTWTPAVLLGLAGLFLVLRKWPLLAGGALAVTVATTWVNGSMADWWGADAFGGRRFDVIVPFVAIGFAAWIDFCRRHPLAAPAFMLALFALWNTGLAALYRGRVVGDTSALEDVASRQVRQVRRITEDSLEQTWGKRARAIAYKFFVGEYVYGNINPSGTIDLAGDARYLTGGWSGPENREGPPNFRWAIFPRSCIRVPLDPPLQDLRAVITARAPGRVQDQVVAFELNGQELSQQPLGRDWSDLTVVLPGGVLVPGENLLCLRFSTSLPEQEGHRAAAVSRIQLP
jgi:hypothetical protein